MEQKTYKLIHSISFISWLLRWNTPTCARASSPPLLWVVLLFPSFYNKGLMYFRKYKKEKPLLCLRATPSHCPISNSDGNQYKCFSLRLQTDWWNKTNEIIIYLYLGTKWHCVRNDLIRNSLFLQQIYWTVASIKAMQVYIINTPQILSSQILIP